MIYEPISIETPGIKNTSYGVGVLTPLGAFVTGPIPPFSRIYVTAFIPKQTVFKRLDGSTFSYKVPLPATLGTKLVDAILPKPKKHTEKVTISLNKTAILAADIVIEELDQGKFKIFIYTVESNKAYQPWNGWSMAF